MQPRISTMVEHHLDQQLGMWTRLLPWRRELAAHLEEAYETSKNSATTPSSHDAVWQQALKEFGNVREVACQLRSEHWPQYIGWRIIAIVAALAVVFSISHPLALLDLPALGFALTPVVAFLIFDTFRGSARWDSANRFGTRGCICGGAAGLAYILADLSSPTHLGAGMALSILSGLYCVAFFAPNRTAVVALVGLSLLEVLIMLLQLHAWSVADGNPVSMDSYWPQFWVIDRAFLLRLLSIFGAGITLGLARFGFSRIARHALAVGAGILLLCLVVMLGDMSDPSRVMGQLLVALGVMGVAVASCHLASDSTRLMQRLLR